MKKTLLTIAIVLGLGLTTFANPNGGGMFGRGEEPENNRTGMFTSPALPNHGETGNQNAPIGTSITLLTAFGAAYWVAKRREQE